MEESVAARRLNRIMRHLHSFPSTSGSSVIEEQSGGCFEVVPTSASGKRWKFVEEGAGLLDKCDPFLYFFDTFRTR